MEKLKEQLILSTIQEGAENPSNKGFSTKKIAERCGVSEFTLFTLFKTKDELVKDSIDYIMSDFSAYAKKTSGLSEDMRSYVKKLLTYGFSHPEFTAFIANYGFWTGKGEEQKDTLNYDFKKSALASSETFKFLEDYDETAKMLVWSFLTRHINYMVQSVFNGIVVDSQSYRDFCADLLDRGILSLASKEAH
jgi:AcrR family transcriptional regulator